MPTRRDPAVLTPARLRVLRAVAQSEQQPATLSDLVVGLGGHPNTTRQHLAALVRAGLLESVLVQRADTGRPPRGHSLTGAGRRALAESEGGGYREIVSALAAHHAATGADEEFPLAVGERWGAARAAELAPVAVDDAWDELVRVMDEMGFSPAPTGTESEVALHACPFLEVAHEHGRFVCPVHEGMARGLLAGLGSTQTAQVLPFAHPAGCLLRRLAQAPAPSVEESAGPLSA